MSKEQPNPDPLKYYDLPIRYNEHELFVMNALPADCYRLIIIESGTGIILFNGEKRILVAPAILCLNETDRAELVNVSNLIAESIEFHPKVVNYNLNFINIKDPSLIFSLTERLDSDNFRPFIQRTQAYAGQLNVGPATLQRARQLLRIIGAQIENRSDKFRPCRIRSYLLELLFLLFQLSVSENWIDNFTPKNESNVADEIVLYLINNYSRKITVNELVKIFKLNRNSLYKQFEAATGLPLIAYLIKLRIKMAAVLLIETSMPVADIMERVGYTDLTHFGRLFKKETGCAPFNYRKMIHTKPQEISFN